MDVVRRLDARDAWVADAPPGYVYRADNTERTKRYFREPPGEPRTHIHVRRAGSFSEQFPLLFRDYLRTHADDAAAYENLKRSLSAQSAHDRALTERAIRKAAA